MCWPVSVRVGNVKNNDPSLIEPVAVKMNCIDGSPAVFVILTLAGCIQVTTEPGKAPYAPYLSDDNGNAQDRGGNGDAGGMT